MAQYELNIEADVELKKELQRTLGNLFATRAGSQPADRDFGIDWDVWTNRRKWQKACFIWKR